MSELQAALLAIGFGVIVAVYAFGWWQQRKYRRKFGAAFKSSHADALYQENVTPFGGETDARSDEAIPARDAPPIQLSPASGRKGERENEVEGRSFEGRPMQFSTLDETAEEMRVAEPSTATLLDESCTLLEVRSDFIIELRLSEPGPAAVLDGLWQRKFDFGKPVQVCGLTLNSARWERAIAESQALYSQFRIALQLVDRGGAVSAAKLADFRDLVLGVAKHIKADAAAPDVHEAHHRAVELDAFCAEVDQMVGINLVPPGERLLLGGKIAQAAALLGMELESDGAFHLLDTSGRQGADRRHAASERGDERRCVSHSLFTLTNLGAEPFQHNTLETVSTTGLTLLLDVPRTENPAKQFFQMTRIARELAKELQVNLVDDHRAVLTDPALAVIREQVAQVEAKMCAGGIAPGSAQALRLFA